jgi:hypothetical protein
MRKALGLCNRGRKGFTFLASFSKCKTDWYLYRLLPEGMTARAPHHQNLCVCVCYVMCVCGMFFSMDTK